MEQEKKAKEKKEKPKKSLQREIFEWIMVLVVAAALAFVVRTFIFEPVRVDGSSMLNMLAADPGFAKSVHLISGFKNEDGIVFHSELEAWKEKFSTIYALDNDAKEGWRTGLVTTFVKEIPFDSFDGDYAVVVVGPPPMMKFTGLELMNNGVDAEKVWMSFERKMSCAVGKCGHCRIDEVYVCLDGPVFPYTVARDLVD